MREWLRVLSDGVKRAGREMAGELKQMAHTAHTNCQRQSSPDQPMSCTREVLGKIRRSETRSMTLRSKSNERCRPLYLEQT